VQSVGGTPFETLTVDFTEMSWARGCKYLLVFVRTFSGWVEAFPTWTEKAWEIARHLLKEIIPQFGIPVSIGSDNGPAFMAEVIQLVAKGLGVSWNLHHSLPCPEFRESRMYEQDSKFAIGKTMPGDPPQWDQSLPIALLRIRSSPTKQTGLSPFEILFRCPPPLVKGLQGDPKEIGDLTLRQQMQAAGLTLSKINDWVRERLPVSLTTPTHPYKPGDAVWVKEWNVNC
jgi:hypothetical protein